MPRPVSIHNGRISALDSGCLEARPSGSGFLKYENVHIYIFCRTISVSSAGQSDLAVTKIRAPNKYISSFWEILVNWKEAEGECQDGIHSLHSAFCNYGEQLRNPLDVC